MRDIALNGAISSSTGAMPVVLNAGRGISSTQPITTNSGDITINTVQPFVLANSLNAGAGQVLLQTGSVESSAAQTVTAATVSVSSGAAWKQIGTLAGNLSVAGTLSAGPAAGSLQVNGALALQSTATTSVDLAGPGQGSSYDSITAGGAVNIAGALQLNFLSGFENAIGSGNSFTILSGSSVTGTFSGLPNDSRITLPNDNGSIKITYNATSVVLSDWQPFIRDLTWDPGTTDAGTQGFAIPATNVGGRFYFRINTQASAVGAWRTVLRVTSGTADFYLKQNAFPTSTGDFNYKSDRPGTAADGFVLPSNAFGAAQTWYIMVVASANAEWSLFSGEAFVQNLGTLASDASSSSGNVQIGPEGYRFFRTNTPAAAAAWRVWLNDGAGTAATLTGTKLAVRRTAVPFIDGTYDHQQLGHMLLVPPYLNTGGDTYFLAVAGAPGTPVNLDSRSASFTDVAFGATTPFTVPTAGYAVFRTQVPVDQIGWQTELRGLSANVDVAVRRGNAASEWFNDAYSEVGGTVSDSVTLVPPTLTDGTYYITLYNSGATATGTLVNRVPFSPTPDDVTFVGTSLNDEPGTPADDANPAKAGWRYFRVGVADPNGINEQLGKLGWELALSGAPAGTEIALRRNFLPGRWLSRNSFGANGQNSTYFQDFSSDTGLLQRPGHQADIWYIGIYAPAVPLGNFTLTRTEITAPPVSFANGQADVTNQPGGTVRYFTVEVPSDAALIGWNLRTRNATGPISMQARLGNAPSGNSSANYDAFPFWTHPNTSAGGTDHNRYMYKAAQTTAWPGNGNTWISPGTWYIAVRNDSASQAVSYTLQSRAIGTAASSYLIKSQALEITNGTATVTDLAARESAFFTVTVPSGAKTWSLKATPTGSGEVSMMVRRSLIPDYIYHPSLYSLTGAGVDLRSPGADIFYEGKANGSDTGNLPAGTYHVMVSSAGTSPADVTRVGTGTASFQISSVSDIPVTALGGGATLGTTPQSQAVSLSRGELKLYSFNVAPGTLSVEVRLNDRVGDPFMAISSGDYPALTNYAGGMVVFGGASPNGGQATELATITNPTAGKWLVAVSGGGSVGSATLSVVANVPQAMDFANGSFEMVNQPAGTVRYFKVEVPNDGGLLGWDLRTRNATGPIAVQARLGNPPADDGMGQNIDAFVFWTHPNTSAGGTDHNRYLYKAVRTTPPAPGSGDPSLSPGTCYIGVRNTGTTPVTYTVQSRAIGTAASSYPIKSQALEITNGTATVSSLPARESAFFTVTVPAGAKTWSLKAAPSGSSEVSMMVRRVAIPEFIYHSSLYGLEIYHAGVRLRSPGADIFHEGKASGSDTGNLPAVTYHVMVSSAGISPADADSVGTGSASFEISSVSDIPVSALGGGATLGTTPQTQALNLIRGELKLYSFTVAPGTLSVEVRLNDRVGGPAMGIASGDYPALGFGGGGIVAFGGASSNGGQGTDLITIANPAAGTYLVGVSAGESNSSATLSVVANVPQPLPFADGSLEMVNQPAGTTRYFTVEVPANETLLGWDLRTRNATAPFRVDVKRGVPPGAYQGEYVAAAFWTHPNTSGGGTDYNRYLYKAVRATPPAPGTGDPSLYPGTYYIAVTNESTTQAVSYTIQSRGIGTVASTYPIKSQVLEITNGIATVNSLPARESAFFTVTVPSSAKTWSLKATPSGSGEVSMLVRRVAVPELYAPISYGGLNIYDGGAPLRTPGPDIFYEGKANGADTTNLPAGTYHVMVSSAGTSPIDASSVGTGAASFEISSVSDIPVTALGGGATLGTTPQSEAVSLIRGELKLYSFNVAPGTLSVEVRLNDRVGYPTMAVAPGDYPALRSQVGGSAVIAFGGPPGTSALELITLTNPAAGKYMVAVNSSATGDSATLSVVAKSPKLLNFSAAQNPSGGTNVDQATVTDGTRSFYQVTVPPTVNGGAPLGWKLSASTTQGATTLHVYRDSANLATPIAETTDRSLIVAPPVFTAGTYVVEVRAGGATSYTVTSEAVVPRNAASPWALPTAAAYANSNDVGDSGQLDLANGDYDFYAVTVPEGNAGVLRTVIEAISGNPDLYIRRLTIPSRNHTIGGSDADQAAHEAAYSRALTNTSGSEYGNWVPYNDKAETQLKPGTYYLAVHAASNTNVRYRLRVSAGSFQPVALNSGSVTNQLLTGGDWRYYKFSLPADATMPQSWTLTFAQSSGDAMMFMRDTVPPGFQRNSAVVGQFHNDSVVDWQREAKNADTSQYDRYDNPGSYTFTTPPLRPGSTYYVGFYAKNDSSFSLTSAVSGTVGEVPALDFYTGAVNASIPANSSFLCRIAVPAEATRLKWTSTHASTVQLRLEQGTLPGTSGTQQHYYSSGANTSLNQVLSSTGWPWRPAETYYLRVVNNTALAESVTLTMGGVNSETEDEDIDTLPDQWEMQYFGNTSTATVTGDPDGDGQNNWFELVSGLDPTKPDSRFGTITQDDAGKVPGQMQIVFGPIVPGRTYTVLFKTDLTSDAWMPLTNFTQADTASTRTVTDLDAAGARKFYRVEITKP